MGFGFWVSGFEFLVSGFRFRVSGFGMANRTDTTIESRAVMNHTSPPPTCHPTFCESGRADTNPGA